MALQLLVVRTVETRVANHKAGYHHWTEDAEWTDPSGASWLVTMIRNMHMLQTAIPHHYRITCAALLGTTDIVRTMRTLIPRVAEGTCCVLLQVA